MKKDRRTIYWNNREEKRKEDPTSWRGHGGTYKLLDYNQDTGQGLVMSDIGPQVMDLRDMNTADAAKKAMIANYAAAEKYPTADPNAKISDLFREQKLWDRGMQERKYRDDYEAANRPPRERPTPGLINGEPAAQYSYEPPAPGHPAFVGPTVPPDVMQKLFPQVAPKKKLPGAFTPTTSNDMTEEALEQYNLLRSMGRNLWPDTTEF